MENLARIASILRDVVWTAVGVLLLVAVVFVLTGGAAGLLPAGLGSGGGSGAGQGGGGSAPSPGNQPGPGGVQSPGVPPAGAGGALSVTGSGDFGGTIQGSHVTGTFTVQATEGNLQKAGATFTLQPSSGGGFTFMGEVTCLARLSTNPPRAIVAGTIRDSNDPSKMPAGSGFALGLADNAPDQIAFEAGFPAPDPTAICGNEAANLFTANHPGFNVTSGDIVIQ